MKSVKRYRPKRWWWTRWDKFLNLKMGLVKSCYVLIKKSEASLWLERGYKEYSDFRMFKLIPEENETIMLGMPKTITSFGIFNFIGAEIIDCSPCRGTYGMGGPGFFGLLCNTKQGDFWLNVTIWIACKYISLDEHTIEAHPLLLQAAENSKNFKSVFEGAKINNISLTDTECEIQLTFSDAVEHKLVICKSNEKLPQAANKQMRKKSLENDGIENYILITHKDTHLVV